MNSCDRLQMHPVPIIVCRYLFQDIYDGKNYFVIYWCRWYFARKISLGHIRSKFIGCQDTVHVVLKKIIVGFYLYASERIHPYLELFERMIHHIGDFCGQRLGSDRRLYFFKLSIFMVLIYIQSYFCLIIGETRRFKNYWFWVVKCLECRFRKDLLQLSP